MGLRDAVQSGWVWQGYVEVSRHSVCVFTQGLLLFLGDCPWVGSQECTCSSVSPILLSPSGSWNKLEQVVVVHWCLGNLSNLKMLFSAHQSHILKMVTEGLGINQTLSKTCFCFSVLLSRHHDCMLGKVWGNILWSVWKAVLSDPSELAKMFHTSVTQVL